MNAQEFLAYWKECDREPEDADEVESDEGIEGKIVIHIAVYSYKGKFFRVTTYDSNSGYWDDGERDVMDPECAEVKAVQKTITTYVEV